MDINIISSIGHKPGGLNRVLLSYAHSLTLLGHNVRVIKPLDLSSKFSKIKNFRVKARKLAYFFLRSSIRPYPCSWMDCAADIFLVPSCSDQYIPDADFIIFSSEKLIDSIARLSPTKGKKVFIVQDVFFARKFRVLPKNIEIIAVSSLVKNELFSKISQKNIYLLVNGIDLKQFYNPIKSFRSAKIVGMLFYNKKPTHKGMDDGMAAFEIARRKYPYLELWMVGLRPERWLPRYIRFYRGRNQEKLADFYRSIDIFLYPSRFDACPLPPMEALACQCALVSTNVGGIADFTIPDKTALVSPPGDIEMLAKNVISLVEDSQKLKEISLAGYEKIKEFSWEEQTKKLEEILIGIN